MPKLQKTDNWYEIERREKDDEMISITIFGADENAVLDEIGSQNSAEIADAKSCLSAVASHMRFGSYDHPFTEVGLHLREGADLDASRATDLGSVGSNYRGTLDIPVPDETEYPNGWARLCVRNGRFYLDHFGRQEDGPKSRKHDFIDYLLQGKGFKVRVLPWNLTKNEEGYGWADTILREFEASDEDAIAIRNGAFNRKQMGDRLRRETTRLIKAGVVNLRREPKPRLQGAQVVNNKQGQPEVHVNGSLVMQVFGTDATIDISSLPSQTIRIHDKRGNARNWPWDRSTAARLELLGAIEAGYTVELKQ